MNEQDMIDRYIYAVTKRVPKDIKQEIALELKGLINDMRTEDNISTEEVLQKLGNPSEFANRYKDGTDYLIGPEYYDNYIWVIKISFIGIIISSIVSGIMHSITNYSNLINLFVDFFIEFFINTLNSGWSVIGLITIIFAIIEKQKDKFFKLNSTSNNSDYLGLQNKIWTPASLPPLPKKNAVINHSDSIVAIIFIVTFIALLLFTPELFGIFHYDGSSVKSIACIFNLDKWNQIAPLFVCCLLVGLIDEIIRLVIGQYSTTVMCSNIICNVIQIIGFAILLKFFPLWNPNFTSQLKVIYDISNFSQMDILYYWGSEFFNNIILFFICMISLLEVGTTIYKTKKYC